LVIISVELNASTIIVSIVSAASRLATLVLLLLLSAVVIARLIKHGHTLGSGCHGKSGQLSGQHGLLLRIRSELVHLMMIHARLLEGSCCSGCGRSRGRCRGLLLLLLLLLIAVAARLITVTASSVTTTPT
jgi:hypothetical protein